MISDKSYTPEEFIELTKQFAQGCANKKPGAEVLLRQDPLGHGVIITISHNGKYQHTSLSLTRDHRVKMMNIFGDPF
jgi:hypothetical protein